MTMGGEGRLGAESGQMLERREQTHAILGSAMGRSGFGFEVLEFHDDSNGQHLLSACCEPCPSPMSFCLILIATPRGCDF